MTKGESAYFIGVFRSGKLLFKIGNAAPNYESAALVCALLDTFNLPLAPGDYIAVDRLFPHPQTWSME